MKRKTKIRICFISEEYPPNGGGIATYVSVTARALASSGNDVTVITVGEEDKSIIDKGVRVEFVSTKVKSFLGNFFLRVTRKLDIEPVHHYISYQMATAHKFFELNSKEPFDVVEGMDYSGDGALINVLRKLKARNVIFLLRLHTPLLILSRFYKLNKDKPFYVRSLGERINFWFADKIACPSEVLAGYAADYTSKKIDKVGYIIDTSELRSGSEKFIPTNGENRTIIFPGRMQDGKGADLVVKAILSLLPKFPDLKIFLIGGDTNSAPDGTSMYEYLLQTIPENKLANFKFTGKISRKYLKQYFDESAFCLLPSLYDNFPYFAIESITFGKAVVGSSKTGIAELIEEHDCGLVFKNGDFKDLATKIEKLLTDVNLRNKLAGNGFNAINSNFEINKLTANYENYLLSILK